VATVFAIGAVVYLGAKSLHEAGGHGLACISMGGDWLAVSSAWCECDKTGLGEGAVRLTKASGTLVNLAVGGAALAAHRALGLRSGTAGYALWLTAAVNLFMGGGYLMVDPLAGFGDWGAFVEGLSPLWGWRIGLTLIGVGISVATLLLLKAELQVYLGPGARADRKGIARWLCLGPYVSAGGVLLTGGALLNELGPMFAVSSAAATLGGTAWLAWMPAWIHESSGGSPAVPVARSGIWIALGVTAVLFELLAFGPGIRWG
jgi:hypothetical protein